LSQFRGIEIFSEFLLKSSLILAITLFFSFLFREKSASFRHLLLSISLIALLLLPFLSAFAPGWQSGFLPTQDFEIHRKSLNPEERGNISPGISLSAENEKNSPFLLFLQDSYPDFLVALWSFGLIFLLLKLAFGLYGTFKITSRGITITGYPWKELFLLFLNKTPLKRKIRLLKNERVIIPMTWGVRKPVIMLPAESASWSIEQCSSVLFHELSHIKRRDYLVRLVAKVSCALYWFNPLCWIVFRQLKKEQEKACDEMVLKAGIKPSIYASCLLHMKKSIEKARGHCVPAAAIGMAGKSEFKERLTAILKKQLIPKEEKMKTRITLLVLGIFAAALIGTAKPGLTPLPPDYEGAAVSQPAQSGQNPAAVTDEKEKKEKKKWTADEKKKEKAKKKEKQEKKKHVWISVEEESEETRGKKGEKKLNIYISEDEGGKKIVWTGKEGDKKLHVYTDGGKGVWVIKEDEGEEGTRVLKIKKTGDKDDDRHVYRIKTRIIDDNKLKRSLEDLKKSLENIDKKFKTKSTDQEKALKEMEKALENMEQELEKREEKHKKVEVIFEGPDDELLEIDEADKKHITIKKLKGGDFLFIGEDASFHMEINTDEKIDKKQEGQIKKALAKLKKNLPKSYEVKSEISQKSQKITIKSGEEKAGKTDHDAAMKEIKKFEEELKKILPGMEGKKSLRKTIRIEKEEEKNK
jgi:beta-lactamase regulating signal transducer with metallopeptidase domain